MEAAPGSQWMTGSGRSDRMAGALSVSLPLAAGLMLRLCLFKPVFDVTGDSLVYGDLAKNLLLCGRYALTRPGGELHSTLIRLPGYPLFLALCFRLFGMENYASAAVVQIVLDLAGCFLLADFAAHIAPPALSRPAARATLWLSALCPFTASYAVMPLSETPTLFMIALALCSAARFRARPGWGPALGFTFAVSSVSLLRPDGALVAVALVPALLAGWEAKPGPDGGGSAARGRLLRMAVVCALLAAAPFAVWTGRNWMVFHVFQPLAPRMANDPAEETYPGWERWVKTWCLDFVSTDEIYWNVPGQPLDLSALPARAFDSANQHADTAALAAAYNAHQQLTPTLDRHFGKLAGERVAARPLRFYLWLPLGRMVDMWLRPRVENLPIDLDWWAYANHHDETVFSWFYAGLNALYLLLAAAGLCLRPHFWPSMLAYLLLRSALLMTIAAPETRYTLECFPMIFVLSGVAAAAMLNRSAAFAK
ncbi:MAG: glycosyltransferase family 39 protein [Terracidiphilus sp.]